MPSRFEAYRMRDGVTPLAEDYFNPVLADIDARIADLEARRADMQAVVDELSRFGLTRIDTLIGPTLQAADAMLDELRAQRDALIADSTAVGRAVLTAADQAAARSAIAAASPSEIAASVAAAEAARDAAFVNANVFATEAAGRAAVANGQQFQVVSADGLSILRYRRDSSSASTLMATYPSKAGVDSLGVEDVANDQEPIFSVVDADGRRTWLETDIAGKPTAFSVQKAQEAGLPALSNSDDTINEVVFAITDSSDRRSWLEFNAQGKPTVRAIQLIGEGLSSTLFPVVSGPDIVCWGDSMTAGAGGNGTTYPSVLQSLLTAAGKTAVVRNAGVGGETSVTITARTGATPFIVDVSGGQIPASGGVTITFRPINGQPVAPLLQGTGTGGSFTGSLAGVPGTITQSGGVYTFTRTTAGTAVTANRPLPFRTDFSEARRGDIALIWIGQNGPSNTRAIEDARAIVEHLTALNKRYLVISRPTSTDADDAAWFSAFGRRFVAIRAYMVEFGLQDAGITPTSQDLADIAAGRIPSSLRVDAVHWTAAGYTVMGNVIFNRLNELGWI